MENIRCRGVVYDDTLAERTSDLRQVLDEVSLVVVA